LNTETFVNAISRKYTCRNAQIPMLCIIPDHQSRDPDLSVHH